MSRGGCGAVRSFLYNTGVHASFFSIFLDKIIKNFFIFYTQIELSVKNLFFKINIYKLSLTIIFTINS